MINIALAPLSDNSLDSSQPYGGEGNPNRAPFVVTPIPDQQGVVGTPFTLDVSANFDDPDGDALIFTSSTLPAGLTISTAGLITGTLTTEQSISSTVRVTDPEALFAEDSFGFAVAAEPVAAARGYPKVAFVWQGDKQGLLDDANNEKYIAAMDLLVVNPNQGPQANNYETLLTAAKTTDSTLQRLSYDNFTEYSTSWGEWDDVAPVLTGQMVNPNRGGTLADDGYARQSDGTIASGWPNNVAINITTYITPYDGGSGTPSDEADLTNAQTDEIAGDYTERASWNLRSAGDMEGRGVIEGAFKDVVGRWPFFRVDWDNDGSNSSINQNADNETQVQYRTGHVRSRDNLIGPNADGLNAPQARFDGTAWFASGGVVLSNSSDWAYWEEIVDYLSTGVIPTFIPEYTDVFHGGIVEGIYGLLNSSGGIDANGVSNGGSRFAEYALFRGWWIRNHMIDLPAKSEPVMCFEGQAANLFTARYIAAMATMTDSHLNVRTASQGNNSVAEGIYMLDEYVGQDWTALTPAQIVTERSWLGLPTSAAYPDATRTNSNRVFIRTFEDGIVFALAGRIQGDDHMTAVEVVTVPTPPAGFKYQRFTGVQDATWNDGSDLGSTVTLGTASADVDQNVLFAKLVSDP